MAQSLTDEGFRLVTGGTDNHLLLVDVKSSVNITGKEAEKLLEANNQVCIESDLRHTYSRFQPNFIYHIPNYCINDPFYQKDFDGYEKLYDTVDDRNIKINIMQETRQNKIARLLQKELSVIFQQQTRAMRGVMVSVTRTKISPDLSVCTAYLSVFPSERGEEIIKNINANDKTIRYELGTRVRHQLRIIPELRFFIDDSLDYIDRIDELLKK